MKTDYYIAWANNTSIARNTNQDEVIKEALKIVQSPLWANRHPNGTKITVTNGPKQVVSLVVFWPNQSGSTATDLLIVTVGILSIGALAFTIGAIPVLVGFAELAKVLNMAFGS